MSEPPENEPDAPSSAGAEPEPEEPPPDSAPSDDARPAATETAPSEDALAEAAPSEDAKPVVTEAAPPKKKAAKRKKKKKKAVKAAPPEDHAVDEKPAKKAKADKEEKEPPKPIPGIGTPDGEKLARAVQAFDAGNYALVRALTTELEQAADADVRDYAKGLRRRIDVDPIQIVVLVACLALFLVIAYVYVLE